ncbi:MAG: molecular chaperone SurA, partial [Comamonadaceae bacterium]
GAGFHVLKLVARERGSNAAEATITQTQVRHILIRPDDKRSAEQIATQMQGFKRNVQSGAADFANLARDNSQDTGSARNGGDLGWTVPGSFVPEFEEAMNRLQPGQISDPVVSRFGVHLIQVQGRREAKIDPREAREAARNLLRDRKMEQAYEVWAQEVRHRAYVELREAPTS